MTPYCKEGWTSSEGVLIANNKESVTGGLMTLFMEHVHCNSAAAGTGNRYVVLLDGHSPRSVTDIRWLDEAKKRKQEFFIAPENISYFLHPANQKKSKRISYWVKKKKEASLMHGKFGTGSTHSNLICAVEEHRSPSLELSSIIRSFESMVCSQ